MDGFILIVVGLSIIILAALDSDLLYITYASYLGQKVLGRTTARIINAIIGCVSVAIGMIRLFS
ncbi:MAG: hypothetical protein Q4D65_05030 [Peptostreptococcaceae bacterium]|nr:hypothetical protein [Peptostreptococcaceae bacterium]